jgi:tRNA pseudouridine55 synthase
LLVDKPEGPTSHDVVAQARRLFRTRAVGHTGTLDPFATGLLILVFGGATRLARWAERHSKSYRAVIRLGRRTDTDDRTGVTIAECTPAEWPSKEAVESGLAGLRGARLQRPPAYSARKVDGERSHRLARRGERPEPAATPVVVHSLELLEYRPPLLTVEAVVSAGTYIRSLARDLGELLEVGGHAEALRRIRIGPWSVEQAEPLGSLTGREALLPPLALLRGLPEVAVAGDEMPALRVGREILRPGPTEGEAALVANGRLVAVGRASPRGWHPAVVLPPDEGV